jgi:pimeloyl-ACP methyl ester carboxylesterase
MPFLDVPDARLYYEAHGDSGPALLMSPGNSIPSSLWGPLVPLLSDRFRVVIYDMRGIGRTEVSDDHPSIETYEDDLHALVEAVGGPAYSLGHAWGAWVAGVHAIRHPEDVRGLVLCSLAGWFPITPDAVADSAKATRDLSAEEYGERYAAAFCGPDFLKLPQAEPFLRGVWEAQQARTGGSMQARALREFDRPRYWAQWTQPTLLFFGTHDRFATPPHAFELERVLARAELHWLYRAGHFTPIEAPEEVAARAKAWAGGLG